VGVPYQIEIEKKMHTERDPCALSPLSSQNSGPRAFILQARTQRIFFGESDLFKRYLRSHPTNSQATKAKQ